jgi:RNA polymerase sigma-70 factor (ECF subfamily)
VRHEQIGRAFLSALQLLPPRQRATLLLAEVLGFSAAEIGEMLDTSAASVNSALQRARATLEEKRGGEPRELDEKTKLLLERYVAAWNRFDLDDLVALLREDAVLTMPPNPTTVLGRDAIIEFWRNLLSPAAAAIRVTETSANGAPAYLFSIGQPIAIQVLTLDDGIARIDTFTEAAVIQRFIGDR